MRHLKTLLGVLMAEGVTVKLRKCQFVRKEISFLGHIVSSEGVRIDPSRVEAIIKFPAPRNIKELRAFLGLANYEKRFCQNHADLVVPLLRLLKKNTIWSWGATEKEAFDQVKNAYLDVTMVAHPDFNKAFYIQCDSSGYAIGGSLFQLSEDGERQVIAYTSCTLKGSQLGYTTTEKEMFALLSCLQQWRCIVLGHDIVVRTDHKALTFFLTCKLRSARLSRWILYIQEFNLKIEHCPGVDNKIADTLSRFPPNRCLDVAPEYSTDINIRLFKSGGCYKKLKPNFKNMRADQLQDKWIAERLTFLEVFSRSPLVITEKQRHVVDWFCIHDGLLFKRGDLTNPGFKLCVPRAQVRDLVIAQHEEQGHFGKNKVFAHMRELFYWPKMQKMIRQIVTACDLCQKSKPCKMSRGPFNAVVPEKPGALVCLDLVGPLPSSRGGATQLLVIVDAFSKFVKLYALKRATTRAILNKLLGKYVIEVQKPLCVLSDNGTQFTARTWVDSLEKEGIQVKYTSVYFPQGNITERYNREIGRLLRAYCADKHTRWAYMLDFVEQCLNSAINDSTGYTALYLQQGCREDHPIMKMIKFPVDSQQKPSLHDVWILAREKLLSKAERRIEKHNSKNNLVEFQEGEMVLVRNHKLSSAEDHTIRKFFLLFSGPYRISGKAGPNCYTLVDAEGNELSKQNVINLKRYKELPSEF
ncbi:unnamed protein product [Callosobruchus maculatus]|uniref:RNA-directed DNA polymerase n=1 Tax=Callosobruchus maculatus TaxID=64391 RepID=A0A653BKV2_CALMS|nr:unnamed protein product [Callosobruchus maculatus]